MSLSSLEPGAALLWSRPLWRNHGRAPKSPCFKQLSSGVHPMADADRLTLSLSSGGDVVIKLRPDLAPGHVERITELANSGFYDGVVFHRVIPGFMAQGGDPTGTGYHGSDLPNLKAEFSRVAQAGSGFDGPLAEPRQRQQPVLHRHRRFAVPRSPVHRLGRGRERHGTCRCPPRRRTAARAGQDRQGKGFQRVEQSRPCHRRLVRTRVEFARQLSKRGHRLVLAARRKDRLEELAKESATPERWRSTCRRRTLRPS